MLLAGGERFLAEGAGDGSLVGVIVAGVVTIIVALIGAFVTRSARNPQPQSTEPDHEQQLISAEIADLRRQRDTLQSKLDRERLDRSRLHSEIADLNIRINWLLYILKTHKIDAVSGEKIHDTP